MCLCQHVYNPDHDCEGPGPFGPRSARHVVLSMREGLAMAAGRAALRRNVRASRWPIARVELLLLGSERKKGLPTHPRQGSKTKIYKEGKQSMLRHQAVSTWHSQRQRARKLVKIQLIAATIYNPAALRPSTKQTSCATENFPSNESTSEPTAGFQTERLMFFTDSTTSFAFAALPRRHSNALDSFTSPLVGFPDCVPRGAAGRCSRSSGFCR